MRAGRRYGYVRVIFLLLLGLPFVTHSAEISHLRNQRYCEIIIPQAPMHFAVYNTIGLNDCPEAIWKNITVDSIKKETHKRWVFLNGPRYWVIDGLTNSKLVNPTTHVLGGLTMREAGILHLRLITLLKGSRPYHPYTIDRETTWVYKAKSPVYELINSEGAVYVMQSYSVAKEPQTESSLAQLGSKLKLPKGWHFKTGILSNDETLQALHNKATVLQDNFLNTYQLATHDFLEEKMP